jgi:hypothetical protein
MPIDGSEWRALTFPVTGARTTATSRRRHVAGVGVDRGLDVISRSPALVPTRANALAIRGEVHAWDSRLQFLWRETAHINDENERGNEEVRENKWKELRAFRVVRDYASRVQYTKEVYQRGERCSRNER